MAEGPFFLRVKKRLATIKEEKMPLRFNRILLKVGGESLLGDREYGISHESAKAVALQIKEVHDMGVQVAVVIGGGNIFRGISAEKSGFDRATADYMGMLATVMNGLALMDALERVGVPVRLQSALEMPAVAEPFVRRRAIRHMEKGRVIILAAGTGVPFVTTDTGSSLHALELHCDVVIKATKVDGVFERDPMQDPSARRYKTVNLHDMLSNQNISVMDSGALAMCMENNMPVMVFELFKEGNLKKAVSGEDIGTYASADVKTELA
ncbi:MAG: Uridylate kinase [Microgenomates group bacterium GW2011_GWF1_44_10]|nr:MAG: Uridylate kinase [Microgenomates group bacterium GW2011_GWF1_44_10]